MKAETFSRPDPRRAAISSRASRMSIAPHAIALEKNLVLVSEIVVQRGLGDVQLVRDVVQ